jgi:valyl-tRNA synthetase
VPLRGQPAEVDRTRAVLGRCLDTVLRLLHPVMPFVTDELWRALSGLSDTGETLALAAWPAETGRRDASAVAELGRLQELVAELRRFRTQQGIASRRKLGARVLVTDADSKAFAEAWSPQLASLADLTLEDAAEAPPGWETLTAGGMSVALDLLGSIDVPAEKARLVRALEVAAKEIKQTGAKLSNDGFLAKAPESVVAEIRQRHEAALAEQALLQSRLDGLG